MTDILILMAALVAALFWLGRQLASTRNRLERVERRLTSAKLTLAETKQTNEELAAETMLLKQILTDVAKGEAHVWIEDGLVRATRTADGETPIH